MAAELAYRNGQAQIAYFGETPWHKEGVELSPAETHDYDSIFRHVEFDYPLEKLPYFRPSPTGMVASTDSFYIQRKDTGVVLGSVGSDYEIITNADTFRILKPLVDNGFATIETGGVLREGADAWLMVKWDFSRMSSEVREVLGDEVVPYSAAMANHNGRRGVMIGDTPIRIVCANTLGAAETNGRSRWITVNHRHGANTRLVDAAEKLFGNVIARYESLAQQYKALRNTVLTDEMFSSMVLDVIAPLPQDNPKFNPEAKLAHIVVQRAETKRLLVKNLWRTGKGHTGEPTAWYAMNAAIEAIDHNKDLWPQRGGSWRTQKLLTGDLAKLKDEVTDNLVGYAMGV